MVSIVLLGGSLAICYKFVCPSYGSTIHLLTIQICFYRDIKASNVLLVFNFKGDFMRLGLLLVVISVLSFNTIACEINNLRGLAFPLSYGHSDYTPNSIVAKTTDETEDIIVKDIIIKNSNPYNRWDSSYQQTTHRVEIVKDGCFIKKIEFIQSQYIQK